jgi:large subunit ribosomal protein L21
MYAIVETGGKQYRVTPGDLLQVELLKVEKGEKLSLDKVLLVADDDGVKIGNPFLEGATVDATIMDHGKSKKVLVFKYKSKKNYRRLRGHRQNFTEIRIDSINL